MERKRRILPPVYMAACILLAVALHFVLPIARFESISARLPGAALVVFGLFMTASAAGAFKRAGTPLIPFEPSTALVTSGWFRITRNPMYAGMVTMLVGLGLALGSAGALLPVPLFIAIVQTSFILGEERMLTEIFGQQYVDYQSRVRRWI